MNVDQLSMFKFKRYDPPEDEEGIPTESVEVRPMNPPIKKISQIMYRRINEIE